MNREFSNFSHYFHLKTFPNYQAYMNADIFRILLFKYEMVSYELFLETFLICLFGYIQLDAQLYLADNKESIVSFKNKF